MLEIYPLSKRIPPRQVDDYGCDHGLDLYDQDDDSSYDTILRMETEFDGILGVQEYLEHLMQLGYDKMLMMDSLGYTADENRRNYPLSGGFREYWDWQIIYDFDNDCLVFQLWMNNPYD